MAKTDATKTMSEILSGLIRESGMEYRPLAAAIGISQASLSKYAMNGAEPGITALVKLADYFKVSIDYLAGRTETRNPNPDLQAAAEFTGLSEDVIKWCAERKVGSWGERDAENDAIWVVNYLIAHPGFRDVWWPIINARTFNWAESHKKELADNMTDEEADLIYSEEELARFGTRVAAAGELALLHEYRAVKAINQIVSEMCSNEYQDDFLREALEGRGEADAKD